MQIKVDASSFSQARWQDYAIRFLFGGLITAIAGLIAKQFGPVIGGLFLAFPAIFPASATLVEKHERHEKEKVRLRGDIRGKQAASADAAGASIGSIGMLAFAILVWKLLPNHKPWVVLVVATLVWFLLSILSWKLRKLV